MFERELERQEELGLKEERKLAAERGRSPSDAASVLGPACPPGGHGPEPACALPRSATVGRPSVASPAAQNDPPRDPAAASGRRLSDLQREVELVGDLSIAPDDELFPEEPFEEPLRRPQLLGIGKSKGRRLAKPAEPPQPPMTPQQRLLILDTCSAVACRLAISLPWWACASTRFTPGRRSLTRKVLAA